MSRFLIAAAAVAVIACDGPSNVPPALRVSSVIPSVGLPTAETAVRINGAGFMAGSTVTMGGTPVSATVASPTLIEATAPPHPVGSVNVVVTNPGGASTQLTNGFTYALPPPPALTALTVSGNTNLTSVGETSQLTATARFVDGSTRDVSSESQWTLYPATVVTVSPSGLLTAIGLGQVSVNVRYPIVGNPSRFSSIQVIVTPPGTFTLAGRAREPGIGSLGGVLVRHLDTGQMATTSLSDGYYSFGGVTSRRLAFTRADFEPVEVDAQPNIYFEVAMQRVYRLSADATTSQTLAPNDMEYTIAPGVVCEPCHLVRLTTSSAGKITIRISWTGNDAPINLWANDQTFLGSGTARETVAELTVGAGETLLYVGRRAPSSSFSHTAFSITAGPVTAAER